MDCDKALNCCGLSSVSQATPSWSARLTGGALLSGLAFRMVSPFVLEPSTLALVARPGQGLPARGRDTAALG
jgi:hypothetical protein